MRLLRVCPLVLLALPLGCDAGAAPPDAGSIDAALRDAAPADVAAGDVADDRPDAAPALSPLRLQATFGGEERAPNTACIGRFAGVPRSGEGERFSVRAKDFQIEVAVPSLRMNVFLGAVTPGACAAPGCYTATTDDAGVAELHGTASSLLSIEMLADRRGENEALNPTHAIAYTFVVPSAGATTDLLSISESTRRYMPQSAGLAVIDGTAQVMGLARDCDGALLKNAVVRVFDSAGAEVALGAQGPGAAYTNVVHRPDRAQRATNFNGQFLVVNLSASGAPYRVETWGVLREGESPTRVGCDVVPTTPNTVSLFGVWPSRNDPQGHPCHRAGTGGS